MARKRREITLRGTTGTNVSARLQGTDRGWAGAIEIDGARFFIGNHRSGGRSAPSGATHPKTT